MSKPELGQFARTLSQFSQVKHILFYPHPLNQGGIVLVTAAENGQWLQMIGEAQRRLPRGLSLHCLRPYELKLLDQPGIFAPPLSVNEFPHLLYSLIHRGSVLFGEDIRSALPKPPAATPQLVAMHIEGCTDTFRRYGILPQLIGGQYARLLKMVELETRRLMATALLLCREWDVDLQTVPIRFQTYFPDEQIAATWRELKQVCGKQKEDKPLERDAVTAVWLFERFLIRLEQVIPCR